MEENLNQIFEWQYLDEEDINHIKNVATSIVFARENILSGGSFVTAIISNDLERAIMCADATCIKAIKLFVMVKLWLNIK